MRQATGMPAAWRASASASRKRGCASGSPPEIVTPPLSVNFTAFDSRLKRICLKRIWSAVIIPKSGGNGAWMKIPFFSAWPRKVVIASRMVWAIGKVS